MHYSKTTTSQTGIVARAKAALTAAYTDKQLSTMTEASIMQQWQRMTEARAQAFVRSQGGPELPLSLTPQA